MDHWQRLEAALTGGKADRAPVALWRHFPEEDQQPGRLAALSLQWQRRWDFDLVKFMPSGTYGVEDWGAVSAWRNQPNGAREVVRPGIRCVQDWWDLPELDTRCGAYGRQNEALAVTARELGGRVPILQTVFSPLTTARKLAGERLFADLRRAPDALERALGVITNVTVRFAQEAMAAGAHGVFFATQLGSHRLLTQDEYRQFGRTYDLQVLNALRGRTRFDMLHVHGVDLMFDSFADYPVQMLNWHDRLTEPTLAEAARGFPGLLAGGLDEGETLVDASTEAVEAQVREALAQTGGRRLVIAPGCVLRIDTPDDNIKAVLRAARCEDHSTTA